MGQLGVVEVDDKNGLMVFLNVQFYVCVCMCVCAWVPWLTKVYMIQAHCLILLPFPLH